MQIILLLHMVKQVIVLVHSTIRIEDINLIVMLPPENEDNLQHIGKCNFPFCILFIFKHCVKKFTILLDESSLAGFFFVDQ